MISYDDYRNFKQEFECIRNEFFQFKDLVRNLEQKVYIIDNEINNIKYQVSNQVISNELNILKQELNDVNKQIGIIMNDLDAK